MSKEYDCRGHCLNLRQKPLRDEDSGGYLKNTLGYYCTLTDKKCTGAKNGGWIWSDDKLDAEIIERCPSRKTIDDVIIENIKKSDDAYLLER